MRLLSIRVFSIGLLLAVGFLSACTSTAKEVFKDVDRIVAVGDLHGDYDQYIRVLQMNALVDEQLHWRAGKTHFVQLGDVVDRGPESVRIIRHLMALEKEAKKSGGRVHLLIGNHEAMNIQGDLRYVHPGEYRVLVTKDSETLRARYVDAVYQHRLTLDPSLASSEEEVMDSLKKRFPLGYVEHRILWEPSGELAKWVASHNAAIRINDSLFVHGGLNPHLEYRKLKAINRQIKKELSTDPPGAGLSNSQDGPLWYRGLAQNSAEQELGPLLEMLEFYDASRIVIAHTTTHGVVLSRFDDRVIMIDVGIASHYGGSLASLQIQDGNVLVMHRGTLIPMKHFDKSNMDYLNRVSELDPEGSVLRNYVGSTGDQSVFDGEVEQAGGPN